MTRDPFGTATLRAAVVEAWRRSPARLREDANTEEDHARGYYRDRVVVELAQNAADAASRTGTPGRLLLRLTSVDGRPVLLAANTGAPLDAAGVAALATMRASAKRDSPGLVGRFGVGFAATRAVADEILVATADGEVCFSLAHTRDVLSREPDLAGELARRGDALPALRLPFPAADDLLRGDAGRLAEDGALPSAKVDLARAGGDAASDRAAGLLALARRALEAFDTAVVLELRDSDAVATVRALLGEVGDPLLLALPGLAEITVETPDGAFTVADVEERWLVARRSGTADATLLVDRPTEERSSSSWQLAWALPRAGVQREGVVYAPTPTLEPLTLPALLVGTLPLDPTRRHVAPGPLTDVLVRESGELYGELGVLAADEGRSALDLVPTGPAAGSLDARLRHAALDGLASAPVLVVGAVAIGAADGGPKVAPRDATALAGDVGNDVVVVQALGAAAENLVLLRPGDESRAAALGVGIRSVGDVVDELGALPSPGSWRELYTALEQAAVDPIVRESLGGIGVPLADGRTVRGVRGTVLLRAAPEVVAAAEALALWGLRVVHPDAEHPLLARLGAVATDATVLLAHPAVRAAIDAALEDDDVAAEITEPMLTIAAAADEIPPWLGALPLPDADGGFGPARELVMPGSAAHELLDLDVVGLLDADVASRWPDVRRIGVITGLAVRTMPDVTTGPALLADDEAPDAWGDYLDELTAHLGPDSNLGPDVNLGDLEVIADLDAVRADAWAEVLRILDEDPATHRAVTRTVRGRPSYTAWWLRHASPEHLDLGAPFALEPSLEPLLGTAPTILEGRSAELCVALGGVRSLAEIDASDWADVDLGEPGDVVEPATARAVWDALGAGAAKDDPDAEKDSSRDAWPEDALLPAVVAPDRIELARAADVVVVPGPHWFQRTDVGPMLLGHRDPERRRALAERLGLAVVAEERPDDDGVPDRVPEAVRTFLPTASESWFEHQDLRVGGEPVEWWPPAHAVHLAGLARALAWSDGHWPRRAVVEIALSDPDRARELAVELAAEEDAAP